MFGQGITASPRITGIMKNNRGIGAYTHVRRTGRIEDQDGCSHKDDKIIIDGISL